VDISKEHLFLAASKLGIPKNQVEALWVLLENRDKNPTGSSFSTPMFYLGAMIIISAMTWLLGVSWERFGGGGITLIAGTYAILFTWMGAKLWTRQDLKTPAGLFITIAVSMTPLVIYGLETYLNIWPQDQPGIYKDFFHTIKESWIFMEIGTIFAGSVALIFFSFPFLTAPIFLSAWFLTMDVTGLLIGSDSSWEQRAWISMCFGLVLIGIAYLMDWRKTRDYAFWGYFFGALTFWIGLNGFFWNKNEIIFFIYLLVNLLMMVFSILLRRRVFMVFGVIGVFVYFHHLAYEVFKDSILYPFVLSFIGLSIMYLGVLIQRNFKRIEKSFAERMPLWMRNLFPIGGEDENAPSI
jgi:hypothetical protein